MISEILSSGLPDLFLILAVPTVVIGALALTDSDYKNAVD
ncbi:hypothetical protein CIP101434_02087 [Corynebacterium diphtheriae]|nr:hypothetical protein CIP101280_01798 [Corynebacterium diphtheriae]CAB0526342.1 hypothetical protein CIP101434_02087 [Corynebacterium diphtheriae]CAB0659599.1 hypothetical protein CIP107570_01772 [Corynebacterium diphtheriae]CAB0734046.1 hypothetical protein FRC0087_01827 [Corynebacterium diphtheriae]CAB0870268.1 hypothetical protein FRC0370_01737 [Corynebacterium diphtheriae]